MIKYIKKWKLAGFFIWKKNLGGKIFLHQIFWIFQNFIIFLKIHLKIWSFAHILLCLKTTSTPKIRRFCWKFNEIFHFLCFLSFGCHTHKNWRKISNKKRTSCKRVWLIYRNFLGCNFCGQNGKKIFKKIFCRKKMNSLEWP